MNKQVEDLQSQIDSLQMQVDEMSKDNTADKGSDSEETSLKEMDLEVKEDIKMDADVISEEKPNVETDRDEEDNIDVSDPRYEGMYLIQIFSNKNNTTDLDNIKAYHFANDYLPLYQLEYSEEYDTCQFYFADESYSPSTNNDESLVASGNIAPQAFWEYVDLIFQSPVTEYTYDMDENGIIKEKVEPYIVAISYHEGKTSKRIVINTPDRIGELVDKFQNLTDELR